MLPLLVLCPRGDYKAALPRFRWYLRKASTVTVRQTTSRDRYPVRAVCMYVSCGCDSRFWVSLHAEKHRPRLLVPQPLKFKGLPRVNVELPSSVFGIPPHVSAYRRLGRWVLPHRCTSSLFASLGLVCLRPHTCDSSPPNTLPYVG